MRKRNYFFAALLCALVCLSCETRDPVAEYETLASTAYDFGRGMDITEEYLSHFRRNRDARISDVEAIHREYGMMEEFYWSSFDSMADWMRAAKDVNAKLSDSNYPGVRESWTTLLQNTMQDKERDFMRHVNESDFSGPMANAARQLCQSKYLTWDVESVREVSIGPVETILDGTAKQCSGEYIVTLRGNIIGVKTYDASVAVSGQLYFNTNGNLTFNQADARILDGPWGFF